METQLGEKHKSTFINVCTNQPIVTKIVGTNLLETPISPSEHKHNNICRNQYDVTIFASTNLLERPIPSLYHQVKKICVDTKP